MSQSMPSRQVRSRNVLWLTANAQFRFNNKWGLLTDGSIRRSDLLNRHELYLLRIAPAYWIKPDLSVAAGYAHLWAPTSEPRPVSFLQENRLYEQMIFLKRLGTTTVTHRIRLEQRWREAESNNGGRIVTQFTNRYRYLLGLRIPMGKSTSLPLLLLAEEIMLHSGPDVDHGPFEQNRLFAGLDQPLSKRFRLEAGYMYTWQKALNGYVYNSIHTLRITLNYLGGKQVALEQR